MAANSSVTAYASRRSWSSNGCVKGSVATGAVGASFAFLEQSTQWSDPERRDSNRIVTAQSPSSP